MKKVNRLLVKKIKGGTTTAFNQELITFRSWYGRGNRRGKGLMKPREKARIKHSRLGSRPKSVGIVTQGKPWRTQAVARKGLGTCSDQGKLQSKKEGMAVLGPRMECC